MSAPLIPYVSVSELELVDHQTLDFFGRAVEVGPWSIKPFGALVALGVYLGAALTVRLAKQRGMHVEAVSRFILWVMVSSFICAHVFDAIFYHPHKVLADPITLLRIWDGLSSFGGFLGAVIGVFAFKRRFRVKRVLPFCEVMGTAFPVGWMFGRAGCATVHDHPGMLSDAWFAVQFPGGGRFDLGLYEMVFAGIMAVTCLLVSRPPRAPGFIMGFLMIAYAPFRFALDFLRARPGEIAGADPRYGVLTPAQWACFVMVAGGIYFLWRASTSGEMGNEVFAKASRDLDLKAIEKASSPSKK